MLSLSPSIKIILYQPDAKLCYQVCFGSQLFSLGPGVCIGGLLLGGVGEGGIKLHVTFLIVLIVLLHLREVFYHHAPAS